MPEIPVVLLFAALPPEKRSQMLSAYTDERPEPCYPAVTAVTESGKMIVRPVSRTERRQTVSVSLCPLLRREEEIAHMAAGLVEQDFHPVLCPDAAVHVALAAQLYRKRIYKL